MRGKVSYCFFCGSAGAAGGTCSACLVPIANPYAESAAPVTLACPRCATPLLSVGIAPGTTVHACSGCHGVMLGARAWCTLLTRPDLAAQLQARLPPRAAPASELVRMLRCPLCAGGREMERGRFGASSNIVIDVCTAHGVWLDGGEIGAVVQHAAFRSKVGADSARRARDDADVRASPHLARDPMAEAVMESARLAAVRPSNARRGAIGVVGILALALIARLLFYAAVGRNQPSASEAVENAGESAGAAATTLGR